MALVYISSAHDDRDLAQSVARGLEAEGFTAEWDHSIPPGKTWDEVIISAMSEAAAVIVLWTEHSVGSDWVKEEATIARGHGKLLPIMVGNVEVPIGFRRIQAARLDGWRGDRSNPQWQMVVREIRSLMDASGVPARRSRAATEGEYTPSGSARASAPGEIGQEVEYKAAIPYKKPWGASGTRIFVAHGSGDKSRIKPVLEVMVRAGFPVWIDKPHLLNLEAKLAKRVRGIEFGPGDWKDQIRNAAHQAHIVLAFWSNDAIDARREQFYYEVYMGLIQRKLCQCRIDDMLPSKIGMPFTFDQIADLSKFVPGSYDPELDFVIQGLPRFRKRVF